MWLEDSRGNGEVKIFKLEKRLTRSQTVWNFITGQSEGFSRDCHESGKLHKKCLVYIRRLKAFK